mgnify:FL=1
MLKVVLISYFGKVRIGDLVHLLSGRTGEKKGLTKKEISKKLSEEAFEKLLNRIHPGALVLLHSTSATNAQILDELLTRWEEMGYQILPLQDLVKS